MLNPTTAASTTITTKVLMALFAAAGGVSVAAAAGNADYLPNVVQPFDANHRALLENAPDNVCLQGKTDKKGRQCHPLLAGHSRDMDTGSVCVELVSDPPQFKVTFEGTGDWALVRTKFWAGSSITQVPTYEDDTTEINLEEFDFYYSNYTGYKRWVATAPLTEQCDSGTGHLRVSMVTHAEVEQVDAYAHLIPGTQQVSRHNRMDLNRRKARIGASRIADRS